MPQNRYYYYDQDTSSFVEIGSRRIKRNIRAGMTFVGAFMVALAVVWVLQGKVGNPYALALRAENKALQQQLAKTEERLEKYSVQLENLAEHDEDLYRTLLEVNSISEDVREAGVGGTDVYRGYDRFSPVTSKLLRHSAEQIDQLERKIQVQNASYRELSRLATERSAWLAEMPAILPADGPIVSGQGMRRDPILRYNKMHEGIDILVRTGSRVVSSGDGIVREAGSGGAYGQYVRIEHPATGYFTLYAHLSEIPKEIRSGKKIKRGETIGFSGSTGRSTGPHLHYEVRDSENRPLNPVHFFAPSMTPQQYQKVLRLAENSEIALD